MPASYPNSVKFFTTKVTGQTIEAAHVNEPQDEITAIEQGLLQGLQHDLIPDASDTRSVGTPTRQWLQAVLKRLRVGDSPGTTRVRTIVNAGASETWITVNADYDGTNWNRDDTTKPARAIRINDDKSVDYLYASSGANPIAWSGPQLKITSSEVIVGTDPGGTEVLRAQNLRAVAATFTGSVNVVTGPVVVGADPGGGEALRSSSLRTMFATFTGSVNVPNGPIVVGTDPGGTELLRTQNFRSGAATFTSSVTAATGPVVVGTDPGGTEVLRAQNFRATTVRSLHFIAGGYLLCLGGYRDVAPSGTASVTAGSLSDGGPIGRHRGSRWTTTTFPSSLTVDLGTTVSVVEAITFCSWWIDDYRYIPKSYTVEYSTDGSTWNIFGSDTSNNSPLVLLRNVANSVRYVRLTVTEPQDGQTMVQVSGLAILVRSESGPTLSPIGWSSTSSRLILKNLDGSGLILSGDPTQSLEATPKQYVDNLQRYHTVQSNGTAQTQRYTLNFTTGLSASDDSTNARTNVSVVNDTTVQKVEVAKAGVLAGTRKRINFIEGQGITITTSDDTTNNKVDVTIASSGASSGAQVRPFLVATSANIPSSDGPLLVRVDEIGETWYELEYPDSTVCRADFEIPAVSFSQIRFVWRTYATSGACRWYFVVREKGNGDVLGSGTVVASGAVNDTAPATANQLKEATVSVNYTPGANKRCAMLGVLRAGTDPADTLAAPARLLWIELL
ncbi:MAG: discoidin domain-containing protein [Candidatus Bilamarchaeaceae archaeon]